MDTGVLRTFITFLPIQLNIYPAVWGEHVDLVGSYPNFRLFSERPCILVYVRGKVKSFQNCHTQITTLLLTVRGWISQGYIVFCLWESWKKLRFATVPQVSMEWKCVASACHSVFVWTVDELKSSLGKWRKWQWKLVIHMWCTWLKTFWVTRRWGVHQEATKCDCLHGWITLFTLKFWSFSLAAMWCKSPEKWRNNWIIHHNSLPYHTSFTVHPVLDDDQNLTTCHPLYSPDLTPCVLLLALFKTQDLAQNHCFASIEEIY
jgi:hypothetical protein